MQLVSAVATAALDSFLSARFNTLIAEAAALTGATSFSIDFSPGSVNYFRGQFTLDDLVKSSRIKLPVMTRYSMQSANQRSQMSANFAGVVRLGIDVFLEWRGGNALPDHEKDGHMVEAAMNQLTNELANAGYPVRMSCDRGPIKPGEKNWVQAITFSFLWEVVN
jgi:hypothetical protein